jgi:hypothetical protein
MEALAWSITGLGIFYLPEIHQKLGLKISEGWQAISILIFMFSLIMQIYSTVK